MPTVLWTGKRESWDTVSMWPVDVENQRLFMQICWRNIALWGQRKTEASITKGDKRNEANTASGTLFCVMGYEVKTDTVTS